MRFFLSSMSVVYVLSTSILEDGGDDVTVEQIRRRAKWENDDYVCRGLILNGRPDPLFDIYQDDDDVAWWVDSGATVHVCKDRYWAVVRLSDTKLKTLSERGIECIFVGYAEHSKALRFYVIEPTDSVLINSIIESMNAIFDENRLSLVSRPSLGIPNRTEDTRGSVVPKKVTEEVVQQPKPELNKRKRNRTLKEFEHKFQLYLIEGTRDEVSDQHSYCFNVEDDPKTFYESMKSHNVDFWKEAINDEMDSIMGNNTWVLADLAPGCKPLGWIYYFGTYDPVARICTIRLPIAMASIHNLIIHQMDVKTDFLKGDLIKEFLSSRFSMKDMGELMFSWVSGLEMKYWKVTLMQARSTTLKTIRLPVAGAATLTKAYRQMYNGKSRHLGVRDNMIRELITNGVVSIKLVRFQINLVDHFTKGLARDLVLKSHEGIEAELNSRQNDIHQSDDFSFLLAKDEAGCNSGMNNIHQSDDFSLSEPSIAMLLSGIAKCSGH
nr:zinc finger, CCHC-type [Tanacetum cinerariifolium]